MWSLSGVNVFSTNLVRGLRAAGTRAHILITQAYPYDFKPLPLPANVPVERLPVGSLTGWRARWRNMIRYLEERAPCIYLPNYDFRHSCVSPKLSDGIGVVGIVHSDDPQHYEHVARLGRYWNAIVAVSDVVAARVAALDSTFAPRLTTIPYGVEIPSRLPERRGDRGGLLKIVYAGRLVQEQKRVLDIPRIVAALVERQVPVGMTIIGSGTERQQVVDACERLGVRDRVDLPGTLPNDGVHEVFEQSDAFVLPSEFEGLPVSLLEAMGRGCVPVVADISSGVPELVRDGVNGFRVAVGDIQGFAERLARLQRDAALRRAMSVQAYRTVDSGGYRVEDMVRRYLALFERVLGEIGQGIYHRPAGEIIPPPDLTWRDRFPPLVHTVVRHARHVVLGRSN